jgi:hypothetical protein
MTTPHAVLVGMRSRGYFKHILQCGSNRSTSMLFFRPFAAACVAVKVMRQMGLWIQVTQGRKNEDPTY